MKHLLPILLVLLAGCAKTPGEVCFERVRPDTKDPKTTEMIEWHMDGDNVKVEMRASNSYGAFKSGFITCKPTGLPIVTESRARWIAEK